MINNSVLRASGNAKTPAMIMTVAAVLNIILDPILIFGLFGMPRLEVEGAAIATVLSNALTMVASILAIVFQEKLVSFRHLWPGTIIDSWRRILHVGLPSMASSLIAPMTTAFITYQVAQFGQEAVAGFGVASRIEGVSLMALMALSAAVTPVVGQNYGALKFDRVQAGVNWQRIGNGHHQPAYAHRAHQLHRAGLRDDRQQRVQCDRQADAGNVRFDDPDDPGLRATGVPVRQAVRARGRLRGGVHGELYRRRRRSRLVPHGLQAQTGRPRPGRAGIYLTVDIEPTNTAFERPTGYGV
jgi:hypothetical protein